uniref:SPX domain-containing protein n=1 Tax=Plectus sambesii TaxID=2011161 RepID=A0A914V594_9BILA
NVIYNIKNGAPGAGGGEPASAEDLESYFKQEDEKFFAECDEELTKINLFYGQKIAEAQQKFHGLSSDVDALTKVVGKDGMAEAGNRGKGNNVVEVKKDRSEVKKSRAQLKLAFSEFYLGLVLVQNYQQLNGTGFRKILKKHDKVSVECVIF